ncbi:hypothetical protein IQ22_02352 [Pseudomonas duriflava]|uniref:Uncharacterized protein n=1 Tax=Pseudomonas duriflava TaxID=459528 RepID=A0A562QCJ6_9PSED|nr:hypothetical protein IQ22_02352 [Pseudomonas duriflava]
MPPLIRSAVLPCINPHFFKEQGNHLDAQKGECTIMKRYINTDENFKIF